MNLSSLKNMEEVETVKQEFRKAWTTILKDIKGNPKFVDIRCQVDWLEKVMERNVPREDQTRAIFSILLFRCLKPNRTTEDDFFSYVIGWQMQMVQACVNMLHDITHDAETRDGLLCWHRIPEVGGKGNALNDAFMLDSVAYDILFTYVKEKDYLTSLVHMFRENGLCAGFSEQLAIEAGSGLILNFDKFTEATYKSMVKYRSGHFYFFIPMATAIIQAGILDKVSSDAVKELALKFGQLSQLQQDYLNCFGDLSKADIDKGSGSDISDGKLTWLIVKALDLSAEPQKKLLHDCYGKTVISAVKKIKSIYIDLGLEILFHEKNEEVRKEIFKTIITLPDTLPPKPFQNIFNSIDLSSIKKDVSFR